MLINPVGSVFVKHISFLLRLVILPLTRETLLDESSAISLKATDAVSRTRA